MGCLLLFALIVSCVVGLDNGVGVLPLLGYNTWDDYRCNLNENDVLEAIDAMVKLNALFPPGFPHKYEYVNIDDCWASHRLSNGTIVADEKRFPSGIARLAQAAHSKGLKLGIYTDRGDVTCQGYPGSRGYEAIDAQTYASWGVDLLKEDSCNATQDHALAFAEYAKMRDALNATGRPILFSLCGWYSWYAGAPGRALGNMWRMHGDVSNWHDVISAADSNNLLGQFAGRGAYNDPDILMGSSSGAAIALTPARSRTQFSLWAIMAAPLLLGAKVTAMSTWDVQTYTNAAMLRVSQDPLSRQGFRLVGGNLSGISGDAENVWGRPLADGSWAVLFLNNHLLQTKNISCPWSGCFGTMFPAGNVVTVRDLWNNLAFVANATQSFTSPPIPPQGASAVFLFTPQF